MQDRPASARSANYLANRSESLSPLFHHAGAVAAREKSFEKHTILSISGLHSRVVAAVKQLSAPAGRAGEATVWAR